MTCKDFEALWIAREDGRLTAAEEDRFRDHAAQCQPCTRLAASLDRIDLELEELGVSTPEPSPYLKTRVLARLDEVRLRRPWYVLPFLTSRRVLALSTACLAFFAGLLVREVHRINEWAARPGTQQVVLELQAPGAAQVSLAGDFNAWGRDPEAVQAEKRDGNWVFHVRLEPGRYHYAFVVDGKKWLPDPRSPGIIPDGFGGMNSVLYVPEKASTRGRSL